MDARNGFRNSDIHISKNNNLSPLRRRESAGFDYKNNRSLMSEDKRGRNVRNSAGRSYDNFNSEAVPSLLPSMKKNSVLAK
jgi:hypothetical protein